MQAALALHDALLRASIENQGGYVFKTVGDAFCAAFVTAPDALMAGLTAQRALQAASWDTTGPLRVRTAVHKSNLVNWFDSGDSGLNAPTYAIAAMYFK
jgi:class 3 adenylate cyclase